MAETDEKDALPPRRRMKPLLLYEELALGGTHTSGPGPKKYTCVDVCARFLACGSTNGSVYIFARSQKKQGNNNGVQFRLLKMISPPSASQDRHQDHVTCLSFCPAQRFLVVGTSRGAVYAISLLDPARIGEKIEFSHPLHNGFAVSSLLWDAAGSRLFSACLGGTVAQTTLRAGVSAIFGSTNTEFLLKEETSIVQLDIAAVGSKDLLLVSSQTRVLILDLSAAENNGVVQVGSKLRQGNYGGCFYVDPEDKQHKVFSTRPGKRVWVGDPATGTVSSTLRFSLSAPPTLFFQGPNLPPGEEISVKNLNLSNVHLFKYIHESMDFTPDLPQLISWSPNSSALFLIDPIGVEIVEWHLDLGIIHDLKVLDASVFVVLHGDPARIAIVRACAAVEFMEIAVSNDVPKSIELAVKYNIHDLALLLNLQCKWNEHVKQNPEDQDKLSPAILEDLESLIDAAATLVQEHTRPPELDIAPPHVVFKQRREASAVTVGSPSEPETLSLKINFLYEKPPLYESVQATSGGVLFVDMASAALTKRQATIADLPLTDKVIDEAWRAQNLPPPSEVPMKPPTLFGEVDLETHLTNATSQLVSLLPERYFGKASDSTVEEEEPEFPPFDEDVPRVSTKQCSALRLAMSVDQSEDMRLIVPESQELLEEVFNPHSDQELVLEAIATDLFVSELQFQSKRLLSKKDEEPTEESSPGKPTSPIHSPRRRQSSPPFKPTRTMSETKKQLIQRTVVKQIGVYPVARVQQKWSLQGTMRELPDLQALVVRPFPDLEQEFNQLVRSAASQLNLWPSAMLTRLASALTNGYISHGQLDRAIASLQAYVGCFDPTIDIAVIQKRKQIEQIKKSKMAQPQADDEELPLTRSDWNLVRLLVSFYFVLLGPVHVETLTAQSTHAIPELGVSYRIAAKSDKVASEAQIQAILEKYSNYLNLDLAAQLCSVQEYPQALAFVLNAAISSESFALECDDLLNKIAEGKVVDLPSPSSSFCLCLHALNVLLKKRTEQTIAWCIDLHPQITSWNIQWGLFGSSVCFDKTNAIYLAYLTALLEQKPTTTGKDAVLMDQWLQMHFEQKQSEDILLSFLKRHDVYALDHAQVSELCLAHGKWQSLLQLVLNTLAARETRPEGLIELRKMIASMLEREVQVAVLSSIFQDMMLFDSPKELFRCVLEEIEAHMVDQSKVAKDKTTYVAILQALFDSCGVELGLELLRSCPALVSIAPLELYQALMRLETLQKEQTEVVTHMLEDIDTYIWSCSRSHHMGFAPQVEAMFRIEGGYYSEQDKRDGQSSAVKEGLSTTELCQFFESRRNDWGSEIQLHDWHCVECDLPIVYFGADERNLEVVVLSCGHAFHDVCLPNRTCPICLVEHFEFFK
ncbi:unnamed protein product [Aphanomyces euteiches]|uniref:RING-type domain-containing protein n=1 Tax=Aphanomyces euteiches TaxID=100861 RepID=A0A6G0WS22_9STRA|nr:hypothetical protein Ae201684_012246 [Aphanomyces euteiches]KAH9096668.1 hypothetical protein Ae201684P_013334 [Aphanomyces euteiches]KAH9135494.1 hypothetical protein AeRB84_019117 [Aphanomyces euteiches]